MASWRLKSPWLGFWTFSNMNTKPMFLWHEPWNPDWLIDWLIGWLIGSGSGILILALFNDPSITWWYSILYLQQITRVNWVICSYMFMSAFRIALVWIFRGLGCLGSWVWYVLVLVVSSKMKDISWYKNQVSGGSSSWKKNRIDMGHIQFEDMIWHGFHPFPPVSSGNSML